MSTDYDPRERFFDPNENLNMALDGLQGRVWTALPGIIQKVHWNNGSPYAEVQPAAMGRTTSPDHTVSFEPLPLLPHCPLHFPRGGGFSLTSPVAEGDECLLVFSSRSLDEWWQYGKGGPSYDLRMHDLSDAIAFVGMSSQKKPIASGSISQNGTQLRSDDGTVSVTVTEASVVSAVGSTSETITDEAITWSVGGCTMSLTGSGLTSNKDATFSGTVTGQTDVIAAGTSGHNHIHTGVTSGNSTTGAPK